MYWTVESIVANVPSQQAVKLVVVLDYIWVNWGNDLAVTLTLKRSLKMSHFPGYEGKLHLLS